MTISKTVSIGTIVIVLMAGLAWGNGLDTRVSVLESQYTNVIHRLDRIESKLDRVIENDR